MQLLIPLFAILFTLSLARSSHEANRMKHEKFEEEHYAGGEHHTRSDHEAVLGSKDTAEEFEKLPPEEAKKRLRKLAAKMDTNKDGSVSMEEATDWIHESMQKLDANDVSERFPEIDTDKDGKITWEEYMEDAFGDEPPDDEEGLKFLEEDKGYFDTADRNADGKLNPEEYVAFQRPENHEHMQEAMVAITMKERDKNHDGVIDFTEFMHELDDVKDKEYFEMEKEKFETEHDKNKDGTLDRDEIRQWLAPDVKETARHEAEHLFKETDTNEDGSMSYDEMVEQHQLWVGSEATRYGEDLKTEL
jgi:Ca2+-binding EF-hand superfamily protein